MTRQRALPEPFDDEPGFMSLVGGAAGSLAGSVGKVIGSHPSLAGGAAAFAVIFGFVSANALFYQPGRHPAPILKTREITEVTSPATSSDASQTMREAIQAASARQVTTYRIEHGDDTATGSIPVPEDMPATARETAAVSADAPVAAAVPAGDPLVADIQAELSAKGLYPGDIDGLMGPQSANAIRAFQKLARLEETGEPSTELLMALLSKSRPVAKTVAVQPSPKPGPELEADARKPGPVTEAAPEANDLVRRIQSGLSNIAYADITVDGVAGAQTRNAIRAFEKHYRLPETGEPNQNVLKKLLDIGAL